MASHRREPLRASRKDLRNVWDRIRPIRLSWSRTVSATYDRRDLDPSFSDQLVVAGFDRLRAVTDADSAASASSRNRFAVRGGYELPFNLNAEVDFQRTESERVCGSECKHDDGDAVAVGAASVAKRTCAAGLFAVLSAPCPSQVAGAWWTELTSTLTGQDRGQ